MEHSVEKLFTQEILNYFLDCYQLDSEVKKLGDFENYVFEVCFEGNPLVLRITHSSHRCEEQIFAELDWVNYLSQNKVLCPAVYPSVNGKILEKMAATDGSFFYGCLFSKVKGAPVKMNSEEFNEDLFYAWGKAIGQMHALTKHYRPKEGMAIRPFWHEEELLQIEKYVPEEKEVIENTKELLRELAVIPEINDNFGLIHTDIHSGNFFYDGKSVYVFDFDDCCYMWFGADLAIPLYYSIYYSMDGQNEAEKTAFAGRFLKPLLKGYQLHHPIPKQFFNQLPLFLKLRDITLYSVLNKKIAPESRNERLNSQMAEMKERIIKKQSIVEISNKIIDLI